MELIRGNLKVSWVALGEGLFGEFNEDDPEDTELLRFDVHVRDENSDYGDGWLPLDDASYCTMTPVNTPEDTLQKLTKIIMDAVTDAYPDIKKECERLSWISPDWAVVPIEWTKGTN